MTRLSKPFPRSDRQAGRPGDRRPGPRARAPRAGEPRRREMRFGCRALEVHSPVFGCAVELSARGLRVESRSALAAGSRYVFRLNYGARYLHLPGRVAWCQPRRMEITPGGPRLVYQAGVELEPGGARPAWRAALAERALVAVDA